MSEPLLIHTSSGGVIPYDGTIEEVATLLLAAKERGPELDAIRESDPNRARLLEAGFICHGGALVKIANFAGVGRDDDGPDEDGPDQDDEDDDEEEPEPLPSGPTNRMGLLLGGANGS